MEKLITYLFTHPKGLNLKELIRLSQLVDYTFPGSEKSIKDYLCMINDMKLEKMELENSEYEFILQLSINDISDDKQIIIRELLKLVKPLKKELGNDLLFYLILDKINLITKNVCPTITDRISLVLDIYDKKFMIKNGE